MLIDRQGPATAAVMVVFSLCILAGCAATGGDSAATHAAPATGASAGEHRLELFVSNQSFDIDPVDIEVRIDGDVVAAGEFAVGNQHNWKKFVVDLEPGSHELSAVSEAGECSLSEQIEIAGDRWASVSFWFYPETHYQPTPAHLALELRDEPMLFE